MIIASLYAAGQSNEAVFEFKELGDLPSVSRYAGSLLLDGGESAYAEVEFASTRTDKEPFFAKGKLGWRLYAAPAGKTALEVFRNYESALTQGGFQARAVCVPQNCQMRNYALPDNWVDTSAAPAPGKRIRRTYQDTQQGPRTLFQNALAQNRAAYAGTRKRGGKVEHVYVVVALAEARDTLCLPGKAALYKDLGQRAYTYIALVEEKGAELGMVEVLDSGAISKGLEAEGRMAFYALYFDTGKAELKPESKPQLEQMAETLKRTPSLNVYVVGHTDSTGALEANLELSRRRAQAVVAALSAEYGVAAARMTANGVGPLAPVASNADEKGRALNRRVELVVR